MSGPRKVCSTELGTPGLTELGSPFNRTGNVRSAVLGKSITCITTGKSVLWSLLSETAAGFLDPLISAEMCKVQRYCIAAARTFYL